MRDPVLMAARDPSCLMCITPWEGGGWFSPISYLQYRNYAYQPLNNKTFADAALAVGLGAYTLEIQFRIIQDNTYGALFDYTGMTGLPKVYINSATRTLYAQNRDGSKSYTFSGFEYGVWYTFKISRLSLALVTTFAVTETGKSTTLADLSLATPATTASDYYISNSFSGNIRSLTFSGPTNYAFGGSEIYSNYGIALPSTTPRNFATEIATWYDCQRGVVERFFPGNDLTFEMDVEFLGTPDSRLFSSGGGSFPLYFYTVNQTSTSTAVSFIYYGAWTSSSVQRIVVSISNISLARHVFKVRIITVSAGNQRIDVQVDGGAWTLGTVGAVQATFATTYPPVTAINGYMHLIRIKNDTTGKTVWSYPNEEERLRLITKANTWTNNGVFEAASASLSWTIKTRLLGASGTVIAKINGAVVVNPSKWNTSTGTFTGLATDKLAYLLAYNRQLSAAEIATFN